MPGPTSTIGAAARTAANPAIFDPDIPAGFTQQPATKRVTEGATRCQPFRSVRAMSTDAQQLVNTHPRRGGPVFLRAAGATAAAR